MSTLGEAGASVSPPQKCQPLGSIRAAKSCEGPETLPFSQAIQLDGQSSLGCCRKVRDSWVRGEDLILIHAQHQPDFCLSTLICFAPMSHSMDEHTQFSKKEAKADTRGLLGTLDMLFFSFFLFTAAPKAHGGPQARG